MADAALRIARGHVRGGADDPTYKRPFVDAAFSSGIFYWDTCFIATYAKYHQDELPIANALDNFYERMDDDGHIGREYLADGSPMWPKEHPVSVNPPLLAFAELELYGERPDPVRVQRVYPVLRKHYSYLRRRFRMADGLYFSDAFGSGMDNIPRYPDGWEDDGRGITLKLLRPDLFVYDGLSPAWNVQGRSVDFSAQMALFAEQLAAIAVIIGRPQDQAQLLRQRAQDVEAINRHCWDPVDGCYYDLAYGKRIRRQHVGQFWTLMAGVATPSQARRLMAHLVNPTKFWRRMPVASWPADQAGYSQRGDYWLGSVWAPTNTMVLRGLRRYGQHALARRLIRDCFEGVAEVFERTGTFPENYAPDWAEAGIPSKTDFCGWTGIFPLAWAREWPLEGLAAA